MKKYVKIRVILFKHMYQTGPSVLGNIGSVWYMCLKIEDYYLKVFEEIRVDEKIY